MYTIKQISTALEVYDKTGSVTATIIQLGYPTRQSLYCWIARRNAPPKEKSKTRGRNTPDHPRHPPLEVKLDALHRCFELGDDVQSVSDDIGYSRASIYNWRRKYIRKGAVALMNNDDVPRGELEEGTAASSKELEKLKSQILDMQLELDILKETIKVIKKTPASTKQH